MKSSKLKILLVHNYYQISGGEDTVVKNEKENLEAHGHKVILYTRHNDEIKKMNIFQLICLPLNVIFNFRTYREIKKIIKKEKIDIVHVHNTLSLISPSVYYASISCGIPVIQTVHNFRFLCPGATFYRDGLICEDCINKGLKCAIKHNCYRKSKIQTLICVISMWIHRHTGILGKINYITLTEFNKKKLLGLSQINPSNVYIKPNYAVTSFNVRRESKRDYYLFAGRIEEIKGIEILISAFLKMTDKKLKIAGDGPLLEIMKRKVVDSGNDNIEFLGRIDHDNMMQAMQEAKAVILTTQVYEGFGMVIPEAYSVGTPMIVGDIGNAGDLVDDGVTGVKFKYNSADSLVEKVNEFEKMDLNVLRNNALKRYEEKYTSEKNYQCLDNIYKSIINK